MLYSVSEVRNFVTGLDHPECVATGCDGKLYAGGEAGQVYRISPDGSKVETIGSSGGAASASRWIAKKTSTFVIAADGSSSR